MPHIKISISALGLDRNLGFSRGHQGHQLLDDDDDEEEDDDVVEDNKHCCPTGLLVGPFTTKGIYAIPRMMADR